MNSSAPWLRAILEMPTACFRRLQRSPLSLIRLPSVSDFTSGKRSFQACVVMRDPSAGRGHSAAAKWFSRTAPFQTWPEGAAASAFKTQTKVTTRLKGLFSTLKAASSPLSSRSNWTSRQGGNSSGCDSIERRRRGCPRNGALIEYNPTCRKLLEHRRRESDLGRVSPVQVVRERLKSPAS